MIQQAKGLQRLPKDTKELVIEMYMSITNDEYPSFNAAMLLFRPILVHMLKDSGFEISNRMNYSEIINEICLIHGIPNFYKDKINEMKNFVNRINHDYEVVMDEDTNLVISSWEIIKDLVESIY